MGILNKIVNILYPPKCIFCQQLIGYESTLNICSGCSEELPYSSEKCFETGEDGGKSYCDGVISVFKYTGIVKDSLIRFKFYSNPSYYHTYAKLLAERFNKMAEKDDYDTLISVPLHKYKEYSRGYNQALLISKALSKELNIQEKSKALKRFRNTSSQSLLDKKDRRTNIEGAFSVVAQELVKGKSVLLVDDIMTTGATLEECGKVLKEAGADKVTALVVAAGRKY